MVLPSFQQQIPPCDLKELKRALEQLVQMTERHHLQLPIGLPINNSPRQVSIWLHSVNGILWKHIEYGLVGVLGVNSNASDFVSSFRIAVGDIVLPIAGDY